MEKINSFLDMHNNDLLLSLAICFNLINATIGIDNVSIISLGVLVIFFVIGCVKKKIQIGKSLLITIGLISGAFLVSVMRLGVNPYTIKYLAYFVCYGIIMCFIGSQEVDVKHVLCYNALIGLVCTAVISIRGFSGMNSSAMMGISYGMLPILLSAISGLICFRQNRILYLVSALFVGYTLFSFAPRGIWLAAVIYLMLVAFYYICRIPDIKKRRTRKIVLITSASLLVVFVLLNLGPIIQGLNNFLVNQLDIQIYALQKFAKYIQMGDALNGRSQLWELAWEGFQNNIWFGNGIGYYEILTEGFHSHNLLLQALCEGGILFFIPLCFVLYRSSRYFLLVDHRTPKESYMFFAQLFTCGIVILFYSSTYWILVPFWIFLGYFVGTKKKVGMES